MTIIDEIAEHHEELTRWRRDIHAHPELGFEEHRTAEFVADKLEEFGIEVFRGIGGTGVVGVLRVGNETTSVGLRADMDALPIHEANTFAQCVVQVLVEPGSERYPHRVAGHEVHQCEDNDAHAK